MTRLAVMAHYDPRGELGPHVRRQVEALVSAVDDVSVVTTVELTGEARGWLRERCRLIERPNYGYDFFSYKVGLEQAGDLTRYDEVIVCNDSYVGPLTPYPRMFEAMAERPVDFWGFTASERVQHHLQSFFVAFRPWVVESQAFGTFWAEMAPLPNRTAVIVNYEIGMTARLEEAGFRSGSFFEPTEHDRAVARRRVQWWAARRTGIPRNRMVLEELREHARTDWNPAAALADRALDRTPDGGRLPYVKIDTLRYDPYDLGAGRLLEYCEAAYPAQFDGVRGYLEQTARFYPPRPSEVLEEAPAVLKKLRPIVEYKRAG
ncbi:rhamnan synthesis F family protein [Nocardioides pacificus]